MGRGTSLAQPTAFPENTVQNLVESGGVFVRLPQPPSLIVLGGRTAAIHLSGGSEQEQHGEVQGEGGVLGASPGATWDSVPVLPDAGTSSTQRKASV